MKNKFYITTPIYYVNAEPHIGHAYTTILADFLKRFYSMIGYDNYFLTGTDEHGDKIFKAAMDKNASTNEYVDKISGLFKNTWQQMDIRFDDFIRTTEERHTKVVDHFLQKLYDSGDIYFDSYGGYYCVGCERFYTEKEMIEGKCPDHNATLDYIAEENYFFRMSKYQDWLLDYINKNPDFIRPERYKNEIIAMLEQEALEDLCISRPVSRLTWGIPLPFDKNYVAYVWLDALINYISALGYPDGEKFKKYWPVANHIIAKDILKQHGLFWPTMLKAAGIKPYQHLNVHGYWNMADEKMSKSLGNVVRPLQLIEKFGNDQIRYFFLREMTFGLDAKFTEDAIINRINYDLANDFGNLIKRTFNMVEKYFENSVPAFSNDHPADREMVQENLKRASSNYIQYTKAFNFSAAIETIWEFIRHLNKYIDEKKPWQLAKDDRKDELSSILRNLLEAIYSIAILISPICVDSAKEILDALNSEFSETDMDSLLTMDNLTTGTKIGKIGILFPRLEKEKDKTPEETKSQTMEELNIIDIKEFSRVHIKVAQVKKASPVEGSEKLLELEVDLGNEVRTIIAGLAKYYSPDSLLGKKILVVANLKPATIFKKKSFGMLLAAKKDGDERPYVIEAGEEIPLGARLS